MGKLSGMSSPPFGQHQAYRPLAGIVYQHPHRGGHLGLMNESFSSPGGAHKPLDIFDRFSLFTSLFFERCLSATYGCIVLHCSIVHLERLP